MTLAVITLAAGKGSRMKSDLPKVLHPLAGKPMLAHVLSAAQALPEAQLHVVVGHRAEQVQAQMAGFSVQWAFQAEQNGTGHAVAQAMPNVPDTATVLILYGDVPLLRTETLAQLLAEVQAQQGLALLTVKLDDPTGYGRIVRDSQGQIQAIVEHKDANAEQRHINEVNTGIMALSAKQLKTWLPQLSANNAQGEYYLTDIIAMAVAAGVAVTAIHPHNEYEVQGVNDRVQLAQLERIYQRQQAEALLIQGVSLADPERLDIRGNLTCEADVSIDVGCVFEGEVHLEAGVTIGPYCVIKNSRLGAGTQVQAFSHLEQARTAEHCELGPYARLRPGAELAKQAKVGNFCEVKKSLIGEGAKVNHLTYIGDAEIGEHSNIGAGTITCNYDGVNKFKTKIGANAFIGSNSSLVAPVTVGAGATVGAGSTITKDVNPDELAIGRGKQRNITGWARPQKQS